MPIVVLTGVALAGAGWYLTRLARSPEVIWDKKVSTRKSDFRTTPRPGTTLSRALSTS